MNTALRNILIEAARAELKIAVEAEVRAAERTREAGQVLDALLAEAQGEPA